MQIIDTSICDLETQALAAWYLLDLDSQLDIMDALKLASDASEEELHTAIGASTPAMHTAIIQGVK